MKKTTKTSQFFYAVAASVSLLVTGCSCFESAKQLKLPEKNVATKLQQEPKSPEYWRTATLPKEDLAESYGPLFVSLDNDFVYGIVFGNARDPADAATTGALTDQEQRQKWDVWHTAFFDSLCASWKKIGKLPGQQTIHVTVFPGNKYAITHSGRVFPGVLEQQTPNDLDASLECSTLTLQNFNDAVEKCVRTAVEEAPSLPTKEFSSSITFGADRLKFPRYQPESFHFLANTNVAKTALLLAFERRQQQSYPFTWSIRTEKATMFGMNKLSAKYSSKELQMFSYDNEQQSKFALDWRPTNEQRCPALKVGIGKNGEVLDAEVSVPSGDSKTDQDALKTIRATRFAALPNWFQEKRHVIDFDLKRNWRRQHPNDQSVTSDESKKLEHDSMLGNFLTADDTDGNLKTIKSWIDIGTRNYNCIGSRIPGLANPSYQTVDLSIKVLNDIISKNPDLAEAFYLRGIAELQTLQPRILEASKDFDESIRLNNHNGLAHWFRAIIHLHQNGNAEATQEAIKEFDRAIADGVTDAIVFTDRGIAYETLGDSDAALKDFDEAVRREPEQAMARWARMRAHYKLAQDKLALQDCEALQKICENPSKKEMFATLSGESIGTFDSWQVIHTILLIRLQRYDEALVQVNKEIASSTGMRKGLQLFLRALAYSGQGKKDFANADFQRASQLGYTAANFAKEN